jgi:hypothetical protein
MSTAVEEVEAERHLVEIEVNNTTVEIDGPTATGLQIKEAAIAQHVANIEITFLLSKVIGEHKTEGVGDNEVVHLHKGEKFTAVADDDNS